MQKAASRAVTALLRRQHRHYVTDAIYDSLNDVQYAAVTHTDGPLLIVAGPGSGKTRTITHRMARLVRDGVDPTQLLAVTFTTKAAGEMKERMQKMIDLEVCARCISRF